MKQLLNGIKVGLMVAPTLKDNTTYTTNAIDAAGFRAALILLIPGATDTTIGSTTAAGALQVEESDDSSTWTDVSGAVTAAAIAADGDNLMHGIHIDRNKVCKRYLRLKAPTAGDGSTGANFCALALLGEKEGLIEESAAALGLTELVLA